jgi:hypothetical protein
VHGVESKGGARFAPCGAPRARVKADQSRSVAGCQGGGHEAGQDEAADVPGRESKRFLRPGPLINEGRDAPGGRAAARAPPRARREHYRGNFCYHGKFSLAQRNFVPCRKKFPRSRHRQGLHVAAPAPGTSRLRQAARK